jgi:hypothetical protein
MTIYLINGRNVDVPADMTVRDDTGSPGAYDAILYRGVEIRTLVELSPAKVYTGPFVVMISGAIAVVTDIDKARELIDAYVRRRG